MDKERRIYMEMQYGCYTENYQLLKPDDKDFYDVNHINSNMDIVDEELNKLNQKTIQLDETVVDISGLIGETENTGGTVTEGTVMAKLNALLDKFTSGGVGIKKVQRGTFQEKPVGGSAENDITITISEVNPEKTFVILRGGATSGYASSPSVVMGYLKRLTATSFTFAGARGSVTVSPSMISYEIVEFY
jgi:hypothetical protein